MSKLQKFLPLLLSVVALVGMIFGMRLQSSLEADGYLKKVDKQSDQSINEALQHIKAKFYGDVDSDLMADEVIDHMVEQLDGYSHYFKPSNDTLYNRYIQGLYSGIGIEFAELDDAYFISSVVKDSPADKVDIHPGDRLINVEGVLVDKNNISRDSLMTLSNLEQGDTLDLSISSWPDNTIRELDISVSNIELSLVHDYVLTAEKEISYVKIDRFYDGVFKEFMDALDYQAHMGSDVSHLIIDLRDNPGGVVEETVKMLNQLIVEKEKILLKTIDKQGRSKVFKSNGRGFLKIERIVIIINEKSASASEILAAGLQDYDRAVVIGSNSYGKGVIQQNYQLTNQGSINLTVGAYILPSGRQIDKSYNTDTTYYSLKNNRAIVMNGPGVTPDIDIKTCELSYRRSAMTRGLIKNDLWTQEQLDKFGGDGRALMLADVYDVTPADSCYETTKQHFNWYLNTELSAEGSKIPASITDAEISKAVEVILSEEYDQLLKS